jgi:hypothetical protein
VKVQIGKRKGKVLIEFATLDDLQRICDVIGLDAAPMAQEIQHQASDSSEDEQLLSRSAESGFAEPSEGNANPVPSAVGLSAPPS